MKAMKRTILMFLCCALVFAAMPFSSVFAVEECGDYNDTNVLDNRYSYYFSGSLFSYLYEVSGGYMRFQANIVSGAYLVEYYDTSYKLLSKKLISEELPIFGGFYSNGTNYFVLSGQENIEESAEVECYRVTKYDLDWKKLSSCGLYDCNTTVPFDAGCPRFAYDGELLIVHTSHEMYTHTDGLNHQSNYTLIVDVENMMITGIDMAYASHSFNQFIKAEGNKYITVDHGDAYPRSIVLRVIEREGYNLKRLKLATLFEFVGGIGENYTGAAVGGFEISQSAYLTAFCTVEQNDNYQSNRTKNVYLAVTDKTSCATTLKQITTMQEGETGAEPPQLVKINDNKFLLIWQIGLKVYYCYFDGNGNKLGKEESVNGVFMSDCQPIAVNGKAVWYSYVNNDVTFYEISESGCNITTVNTSHKFKVVTHDEATPEKCILKCEICGKMDEYTTRKEIKVLFGESINSCSIKDTSFDFAPGAGMPLFVDSFYYGEMSKIDISVENGKDIMVSSSSTDKKIIIFPENGVYKLKFSYKENPFISITYTIKVGDCAKLGDVNEDGTVDNLDAVEVLKYDSGMIDEIANADVNNDGEVNNLDAAMILKYDAGIIDKF